MLFSWFDSLFLGPAQRIYSYATVSVASSKQERLLHAANCLDDLWPRFEMLIVTYEVDSLTPTILSVNGVYPGPFDRTSMSVSAIPVRSRGQSSRGFKL
jgi:hypothetical protein